MKAIIIAGGTPPSLELLNEEMKDSDLIICADSGANCLFNYKICPQYLLGDFDSIDKEVFNYFSKINCSIESYPMDKDYTDTELALIKAEELGANIIAFLGCSGTRLDHTLGNIGLLLKCLNKNIKSYIRDEHNYVELINNSVTISGMPEKNFSLLAYNSPVKNLTIEGAKFPLKNYDLQVGDSLTVSNEFKSSQVMITFSDGILLLLRSFD
jgi:thiamine pyrophosphokinase